MKTKPQSFYRTFFDNDLGDIMAPAAANILGPTMCNILYTLTCDDFFAQISSQVPVNIYVAYNGFGVWSL